MSYNPQALKREKTHYDYGMLSGFVNRCNTFGRDIDDFAKVIDDFAYCRSLPSLCHSISVDASCAGRRRNEACGLRWQAALAAQNSLRVDGHRTGGDGRTTGHRQYGR